MIDGNYLTYIHIESNATGPITIPVSVQVGYQFDIGDVNYDGGVNVIDIVDVVYTILDDLLINDIYVWTADMDFNSELNVIDITKLVNFIFLP